MNFKNKTDYCKNAEAWFKQWVQDCEFGFPNLFIELKKSRSKKINVSYFKRPNLIRVGINFDLANAVISIHEAVRSSKTDDGFSWVYDREKIRSADDLAIWTLGHEIWHYLCHTKQVKGNYQTKANAFGFNLLRQFKKDGVK